MARSSLPSSHLLLLLLLLPLAFAFSQAKGSVADGKRDRRFDPTKVVQLLWKPRLFMYKGFLSDEECNHLISLAKDHMRKSLVVDLKSGKSVESTVRTSSGMFLSRGQDEIISRIERRIATWTLLPEDHGEGIQVLHYENGQKYDRHFDFFFDEDNLRVGQRALTVLMYLSDVKRGGETVFPNAVANNSHSENEDWSECSKTGYAVKPEKGDAVLFFSLHPDGTTDTYSLHGGCPVLEGDKWSATKWVHVKPYDVFQLLSGAECKDKSNHCPQWAAAGECKKNPAYMIGSRYAVGACRKSCNACSNSSSVSS